MKKYLCVLCICLLAGSISAQERFDRKHIRFTAYVDTVHITAQEADTSIAFDLWSFESIQCKLDTLIISSNAALKISLLTSSINIDAAFQLQQVIYDSTGFGWPAEVQLCHPTSLYGKIVVEGLTTNVTSVFEAWRTGWSNSDKATGQI